MDEYIDFEAKNQPSNKQGGHGHELPNKYEGGYENYSDDDDYESFEIIQIPIEDEKTFRQRLMYVNSRWWALLLMVFVIFGSYFCYDNPSELEDKIQTQFEISQTKYSLLYTSYSLPNMIVPVCGGLILTKIGKGWGLLIFSMIITLGQIICAFGAWFDCFLLLVIGRGIHGLGGESQQMVNAVYVVHWFRDQEISFAMGISQMTLLCSFLGGWLIPLIAKNWGVGWAFAVGGLSCILSLIVAVTLICLDNKASKHDRALIKKRKHAIQMRDDPMGLNQPKDDSEEEQRKREIEENSFKWEELLVFEKGFWLMAFDCLLHFSLIETCIAIGTDLMGKNYNWSEEQCGMFVTVPYLVCGLLLAPLGWLVDKYGKRQVIVISSGILTLSSYFFFLLIPSCDKCYASTIPWFLLGYSLTIYYVLMFGAVSYLVRDTQTGTAYGFITCFQNIGTTFLPPMIGYIHDSTIKIQGGYFWAMIAFILFGILSICVKVYLYKWDKRVRGGILQSKSPTKDYKEYLRQQELNLQNESENQQQQIWNHKKQIQESLITKIDDVQAQRF